MFGCLLDIDQYWLYTFLEVSVLLSVMQIPEFYLFLISDQIFYLMWILL